MRPWLLIPSFYHRQTYTTLVRVTYGLNVESDEDVLISLIGETLTRIVDEGIPGSCIVDVLPLREHFF